jgi:hypothetical protein
MPCPVCGRTMQNLGLAGRRVWWCPCCGTLREEEGGSVRDAPPTCILDAYAACDRLAAMHAADGSLVDNHEQLLADACRLASAALGKETVP